MTLEASEDDITPIKMEIMDPAMVMEKTANWFTDVNETFQGFRSLVALRNRQQPYMRLYRDILLGELRTTGIIHVAEQEANSLLRHDISYFQPGDRELSTIGVWPGVLDNSKPHWSFILDDVEFDHNDLEKMEWKEGLRFGFSRTIKESTTSESGIWATTSMTYSAERTLVINGENKIYEVELDFLKEHAKKSQRLGLELSYPDTLIQPLDNFDLEAFRQGLRLSLKNPKKYPTGLKQQ